MKKRIIAYVLMVVLLLSTVTAYGASTNISVDGIRIPFTVASGSPFVDSASRTQVPLRVAMEAYGCSVKWDAKTQTAVVTKDGITVDVPVGQKYIVKDGKKVAIDSAALIKDNRTYLPIRAVLESFGATIGWDSTSQTVVVKSSDPGSIMTIHFINVGQGDSIFIDYGDTEVLIDAGKPEYGNAVVSYIKPYVNGKLDYVIATHTDADHIGGIKAVFAAFKVGTIYDSGDVTDTATYDEYETAAKTEGCPILPDCDVKLPIGNKATLDIIETGDNHGSSNDDSVVSMLDYNKVKVLFTGDMEQDVEKTNLSKFCDVDVLKAGHHGSNTASCQQFLNVVKPEYVIVSAGANNSYGHPQKETMDRFASIGATVYGTFKSGSIVMTTNGNAYSFNTSTPITVANAGALSTTTNVTTTTTKVTPVTTQTTNTADYLYIGNSSTKKFHKPACSSVDKISDDHLVYFKTRAEAISDGYVPCKNCNP